MLEGHSIELVRKVTQTLIGIQSTKHIAKARNDLKDYCYKLSDKESGVYIKHKEREILDIILSYVVQSEYTFSAPRYNTINPEEHHLTMVDNVILNNDKELYKKLPLIMQNLVQLCTDIKLYRYNKAELYKLIKRFYPLEYNFTEAKYYCKRCSRDISSEQIICNSCNDKIQSCVEFNTCSFDTIGTTIEPFSISFKDWKVDIDNKGKYSFTRLDKSSVQYQQKLPFKEFQNLLVLVG